MFLSGLILSTKSVKKCERVLRKLAAVTEGVQKVQITCA